MTQLLDKAFHQVAKLPDDRQDAIAEIILMEMASEIAWDELFEKTQPLLSRMASEARREHKAGLTRKLNAKSI
jgi:TRAP-type C4-dicarboxylate transport system substrate-binding protein